MRAKMTVAAMLTRGAVAQHYDGIADCEHHATAYGGRDADFRNFFSDRRSVNEIAYDAKVGWQYTSRRSGAARRHTSRREKFTRTFICLHGGLVSRFQSSHHAAAPRSRTSESKDTSPY